TYITSGATGANVTGLPAGVSSSWVNNVVTITGTPVTASGTFSYSVSLTGGCGDTSLGGSITVSPTNTVTLISPLGTDAQTVCINTAIIPVSYATTGATAVYFTGLPSGVTANWVNNTATISGTPSEPGNFTYAVHLQGG
ncbi:hypothetical protein, partial [Stenotrophomonas sp. CASM110]|uniref:hypothetical protein n=1 Tax=Stenotrophomonas sp. CASM110 TaxID=3111510 RepID=UPI003BF8E3D9